MPKLIDMAEVQAAMEQFKERGRPLLDKPGYEGVLARLQHDAAPELTYWRTRELNRDTPAALMAEALVMFFAATMGGEIRQVAEETDEQFALANEIIQGFATALGRLLSSWGGMGDSVAHIPAQECGNA